MLKRRSSLPHPETLRESLRCHRPADRTDRGHPDSHRATAAELHRGDLPDRHRAARAFRRAAALLIRLQRQALPDASLLHHEITGEATGGLRVVDHETELVVEAHPAIRRD